MLCIARQDPTHIIIFKILTPVLVESASSTQLLLRVETRRLSSLYPVSASGPGHYSGLNVIHGAPIKTFFPDWVLRYLGLTSATDMPK